MTTAATAATLKPRRLRFQSLDEVVAEAQRLGATETIALGNWTLGQTLKHLGLAMVLCIDGKPFHVPWHWRLVGQVALKPIMLHYRFPAGLKLPRRAAAVLVPPPETTYDEGIARLKEGIERMAQTQARVPHPLIGPLDARQWNLLHLRHAELHLGFILPVEP